MMYLLAIVYFVILTLYVFYKDVTISVGSFLEPAVIVFGICIVFGIMGWIGKNFLGADDYSDGVFVTMLSLIPISIIVGIIYRLFYK